MKKFSLLFAVALGCTSYVQPQVTVDLSNTKKTVEIDQEFALEYDSLTDLKRFTGTYQLT